MNERTLLVEALRIGGMSFRPVNITAVWKTFVEAWLSLDPGMRHDAEMWAISRRVDVSIETAAQPREQNPYVQMFVSQLADYAYSSRVSNVGRHPGLRLIVACLAEMVGHNVPIDGYSKALDDVEYALGIHDLEMAAEPERRPARPEGGWQ